MSHSTVSRRLGPETSPVVTEAPSQIVVADGTLELLKWLGLLLMVADHTNKYFFREGLPAVFAIGRIVMPMFGFILVYNLTRSRALERGVHGRVMMRLAVFGLLAAPICAALNKSLDVHYPWWPLNILATLCLVTAVIYLFELGGRWRVVFGVLLAVLAGTFVEYLWSGVACCLGAWVYCRNPSAKGLICWSLGTLSLTLINGNAWALVSIPLILVASRFHLTLPRNKWMFYAAYPVHLMALLAVMGWH